MSLDIENKIETAWVTLLEANAYIIANSIPVRRFHDNSEIVTTELVLVHVFPTNNEFPNTISPLWYCNAQIIPATFIVDDLDKALLEALYKECLGVVNDATAATLTTAGSIKFNGKTILEPGDQMFDDADRYQNYMINTQNHVQV